MTTALAIIGMACRYPDADSPDALWETVLAQRRAFRRLPAERLNLDDYGSDDPGALDRTYVTQAAVLEGYTFDRVRYRVSGHTFRAVDMAHWLALDVAAEALADAGFSDGTGLRRETTGVVVGNSLTGEFSRANLMRLRWPYVQRVLDTALADEGWSVAQRRPFLEKLEMAYKAPFPPVGTETLAGGLSNTIAGRICNYFDLKGGGFTVDGACASSLLAVIQACAALAAGDMEVALAGGVDLSLDPFELIGFARVGALATDQMRVYDARSAGFWPGEGCGFVVLMPYERAIQQGHRIYAILRGWGVSSDGSGGITRPSVAGQRMAVHRAYHRAGFGPETVSLFEGHGTGTSVGDAVELRVLSQVRQDAGVAVPPAAIGSVKANIGHTKAAAGLAGLLKATLALHHQMLPPTTGCERPHPELTGEVPALRIVPEGESWPKEAPLRAGVSAMGFGGINTHVVLEGAVPHWEADLSPQVHRLLTAPQDAELFLLGAADTQGMRQQIEHLLTLAPHLSLAELADLAATLASRLTIRTVRAAVVAATAAELTERLETLAAWLDDTTPTRFAPGVYLGAAPAAPRIGFLFPGQGSPTASHGGALARRFAAARAVYAAADLPQTKEEIATDVAQPAIVAASVAALRVLHHCGVRACTAVGHSLGELTALHWGGVFDVEGVLRLATVRGRAMADLGSPTGAMAGLSADEETVRALLSDTPVVIAGLNGPHQTVISGAEAAVDAVVVRARARQVDAQMLRVSHAFHSDLVAAAAEPLAAYLADIALTPLQRTVVSTITGTSLGDADDLKALLVQQVTAPVRFTEAVTAATQEVDLWIEVGPGRVLSSLASTFLDTPTVATAVGGFSLRGVLQAIGAAFAAGAPVDARALFEGRFTRPFSLDWQPQFLANPCEQAPVSDPDLEIAEVAVNHASTNGEAPARPALEATSTLDLVRQLIAARAELPLDAVRDEDHLLSDLHLNSITVSELMVEAARHLDLAPSAAPTSYADATLAAVAAALDERVRLEEPAPARSSAPSLTGVEAWIRPFTVVQVEQPRPRVQANGSAGAWQIITPPDYPFQKALHEAFQSEVAGGGVVVALPPGCTEAHMSCLLQGARAVMDATEPCRFVLVQEGAGGAAFARTVHLELPQVATCIVDVPLHHPDAVSWVIAEVQAATGFTEVVYDSAGVRRVPRLRLLPMREKVHDVPLGPEDVLLITGGGKGITAACAFDLAQATGVRLVLVGRSQASEDDELAATLARMADAGLDARYLALDITDAEAVCTALDEITGEIGPITALLHGAARNVPQRLGTMDEGALRETLAPKVEGLRYLLDGLDPQHLRLLVAFGSIIGRMGLPGEAHYALANEQLRHLVDRWQQAHPACRCLTIEWSIWSEVGMGARLGSIDALRQRGITPIPPEQGLAIMRQLLGQPLMETAVVVTGRYGEMPTLQFEEQPLPLWRFLESPRRHVPGVELIVEARLSVDTDPYLNDHQVQGERLLPAVMGLEAMAQAAMALIDITDRPVFESVAFNRPIVVPGDAPLTIRMAALVQAPGQVDVVIRSEPTAFQVDYFRCRCRFGLAETAPSLAVTPVEGTSLLPLTPDELYGSILFHEGRFQRVLGYRALQATACVADISAGDKIPWFSAYLPADLVLGDPGARDAAIHAIQACIPQGTLIPVGVEQLVPGGGSGQVPRFIHARERSHKGDMFVYDMTIADAAGEPLEYWKGLWLRRIGPVTGAATWSPPLLRPYLERRIEDLTGVAVSVAVVQEATAPRRTRSTRAMQAVLGSQAPLRRKSTGKPETARGTVSASHAGALTLAVAGEGVVACDLEPITARPETLWRDLLGPERLALVRLIGTEARVSFDDAATRVWSALECLKKAGQEGAAPLTLHAVSPDGWVVLVAGPLVVATLQIHIRQIDRPLVGAVLATPPVAPAPARETPARAAEMLPRQAVRSVPSTTL